MFLTLSNVYWSPFIGVVIEVEVVILCEMSHVNGYGEMGCTKKHENTKYVHFYG